MSDPFAEFESAAPAQETKEETPAANDDPAAEFLAREEAEFAKVVNDEDGFGDEKPAETNNDDPFGMSAIAPNAETQQNKAEENAEDNKESAEEASDLIIGSAAATITALNNMTDGATEETGNEGETAAVVLDAVEETSGQGETKKPSKTPEQIADFYSAINVADKISQEPEKIKVWREEQKQRLEQKDKEEDSKKKEWKESAKKELDDWYKNREENLAKTHANNKAAEAELVASRDSQTAGLEWERMAKLCDFNPKGNKNTKDVSRMRSILLQLKQTPLVRDNKKI